MINSKADKLYKTVCAIVALIFGILCFYPLLYSLFISFCSKEEFSSSLWYFPTRPTLAAYLKVFTAGDILLRSTFNSLIRTFLGTFLGLAINVSAAYVLSRDNLPGKGVIIKIMIFTILFSGGLIPTYITVQDTGLYDSMWALIVPGLFSAWNVLILKQFMEGIPRELEEAAEIDGVTQFGNLFRIVLPMSKAVLAAICMFSVVGHWNSWFDVSIYIAPGNIKAWTLSYYVQQHIGQMSDISQASMEYGMMSEESAIGLQMALTIVSVLPLLIIYPFFQKYFTTGVYVGAVKG